MMDAEHSHSIAPSTDDELYRAIGLLAADAGLSPPLFLKNLKGDVRATANPRRALTSYHRFLMTGFPSAWLRDFEAHRLLQQIVLELFSQSQYLADILVRNPELFRWLTSSNVLTLTKTREEYVTEVTDAIGLFQRSERKLDSLKRFQRRELLRIGARQILEEADVATTSGELSALADAIIGSVLELAYDQIAGAVQGNVRRELAVIGLGKLGGEELNVSSDIDLVFVYDKDGAFDGSQLRLATLHEYYCRVAEYVVRRLSEHTAEGHLYRVDMRLRPDGNSGPLAMSRAAYFAYYEARGELWERQMLIKSRVVAGDRRVGEGWREEIQPFIYPKTLLASPLEEIARIKARIESNLDNEKNIKLGSGGIRDIEFVVQALQLLNGGNNVQLRQRNTLLALRQLAQSKHLNETEERDLESAYRFLRTVEDRLQLLHGLQRHSIPESEEERRILARQLGYNSAVAFSADLASHQKRIRTVVRSVFGKKPGLPMSNSREGTESVLDLNKLRKWGVLDERGAQLQISRIVKEMPELAHPVRFHVFMDLIRKHRAPDWCLHNFLRLASSAPIKRTLQQAASSDKVLDLLLLLCSRSSRYVDLLSREPLLFEALVGRSEDLLSPGIGWTFLKSSNLQRHRVYNEFKSVLRFVLGEISARELIRELSKLADEIVADAFTRAQTELGHARGLSVALIALGKFGGGEISIGSDLDVILLHKGGSGANPSKIVNTLGRRLREMLDQVYQVDFRLRPEGKNAPLATEFEYYKDYFTGRASLWERQSLVKARFVAGNADFGREVMDHIVSTAYRSSLPKEWKKEILSMRGRMVKERSRQNDGEDLKVGVGGLVDLEFLVQTVQLRYGREFKWLIRSSTFEAVASLVGRNLLRQSDVKKIEKNLEYLRRLEACIRMNSETADFVLPAEKERLQAVVAAMGNASLGAFRKALLQTRKANRKLFTTTVRSIPK